MHCVIFEGMKKRREQGLCQKQSARYFNFSSLIYPKLVLWRIEQSSYRIIAVAYKLYLW
jgi:hypothetical protein